MGKIKKILTITNSFSPRLFPNRVIIEWCENVHFHFRNLRLELNEGEFLELASAFLMGKHRLWKWFGFPEFRYIDIEAIDPYDEGHKPANNKFGFQCPTEKETIEHIEGIKYWLNKLKNKEPIPPILVKPVDTNRFQRMDGFKRLMAMKLFGLTKIPCIIDKYSIPGGQEDIIWHPDKQSYCYFYKPAHKAPCRSLGERFEILSEYNLCNTVPYEGRLTIELQDNYTIHVHYNNIRIEFSFWEYIKFAYHVFISFLRCLVYIPLRLSRYIFRRIADYIYNSHPRLFRYVHPVYQKLRKYWLAHRIFLRKTTK